MTSRSVLVNSRVVVIKAGTSIVCNVDGSPSLVRMAQIVEAVHKLVRDGRREYADCSCDAHHVFNRAS